MPHSIKRRRTSVLERLSETHKAQLHDWLKSSVPYREIVERMAKQWNIKTWIHSLSVYYAKLIAAELLERRQKSLGVADKLQNAITRKPAKLSTAIFDAVECTYFDLLRSESHPKIVEIYSKQYQRLIDYQLRDRQVRVKERRLKVLEKQAEEARKTMQNSKLSVNEQAERVREIFRPAGFFENNGNGFKDGIERATHD